MKREREREWREGGRDREERREGAMEEKEVKGE